MQMKYVFDIDDATKVLVDGDRILQIGKELEDYNGVDMGIFLCSPSIFEVLKRNIEKGRYSLTEAIRELANEGKMRAFRVDDEEYFWIDVDTPRMEKIAEKILSILEKPEAQSEKLLREEPVIEFTGRTIS